jgi:hypothetical protein
MVVKSFYPQIEVISDFRLPIASFSIEITTGENAQNRQLAIGNDLNLRNRWINVLVAQVL